MRPGEEDTLHGPEVDPDATVTAGSEPAAPRDAAPIPDWGHFRDLSFLGEGGMGQVYRARDTELGRDVALKFIRGETHQSRERLMREARAQARIEHPAVCPVYEVGEAQGRLYVAMQLIEGRTLKDAAADMTLEEKLRVVRDVARGVHEAHKLGIIHRDLKPGNVMVERDDDGAWRPYVVDFGLAREQSEGGSTTGMMSGTPHYMAPEQVRKTGVGTDRRTDVYGLGATLYQALLGRKLFEGTSEGIDLFMRVLEDEPARPRSIDPSLPADVETIVLACLAKEPNHRYPSARALADEIDRFLDGDPIEARRAGMTYRLGKKIRKHKLLFAISAVAVVCVVIAAGWALHSRHTAAERARAAQAFGQRVAGIDAMARQSALLPIHPVSRERTHIVGLMDEVRSLSDDIGEPARGPADYALGRGYLALQQLGPAREYLMRAWQGGYRSPDVAYGLGMVLGRLYQRARREAEVIEDEATRKRRLALATRELRDPALGYLRQSTGAQVGSRAFVEAQIAMHEARYDDALARAAEARAEAGWLYEADLLAADVHRIRGDQHAGAGRYDQAATSYAAAEHSYLAAAEVGRSDPLVHQGSCSLALSRAKLAVRGTGGAVDDHVVAGIAACERALVVAPERSDPHLLIARLHYAQGEWRADSGSDPTSALEASMAAADRVIELAPNDPAGPEARALAGLRLAYAVLERGEDPEPRLAEMLALLEHTNQRHPNRGELYNLIGIAHMYRVYYRRESGGETAGEIAAGIAAFERAVSREADYLQAYLNLGALLLTRAEVELENKQSPEATVAEAGKAYEKALAINPNSAFTLNDLGYSHVLLARYRVTRGEDPRPSLARGIERLEQARAIKPDDGYIASDIGAAHLTRARYELDHGLDAAEAVAAGVASLEKAVELRASDVEAHIGLAKAYVTRARLEGAGAPARTSLDRADATIDRALELNPSYAVGYQQRAEVAYWRGTLTGDRGAARRGATALDRAIAINPRLDVADIRARLGSLE